jgi:hypothetical protein
MLLSLGVVCPSILWFSIPPLIDGMLQLPYCGESQWVCSSTRKSTWLCRCCGFDVGIHHSFHLLWVLL